jgi:hypothetical protein
MSAKEYLAKLPGTDEFLALASADQDRWIFQATETLTDHLASRQITDRAIALQTIYEYEGDQEDFAMLKRQGVDTFSTEGLSVSFKSGSVSPKVMDIVNRSGRAGVGSII